MKIPGFEIIQKIGEGGVGTVWKARQVSLDRTVAVKVLHPHLVSDIEEIRQFVSEARAAARLKHPGLIQVFDVAESDGFYYFVMEHIDGCTVGDLLAKKGALSPKETLNVARRVVDALNYAWKTARLVHCDIKPENIMIENNGTVRVADLGLARKVHGPAGGSSPSDTIAGTPNYMAPEQVRGGANIDCRTDIYSLGVVLYHMTTGVVPFGDCKPFEAMVKHVSGYLTNPRDINPRIPLGIVNLITRMMMKNPDARYQSWDQIETDVKRLQSGRLILFKPQNGEESTVLPPEAATAGESSVAEEAEQPHILATIGLWSLVLVWWLFLGWKLLRLQPPREVPYAPPRPGAIAAARPPAPAPRAELSTPSAEVPASVAPAPSPPSEPANAQPPSAGAETPQADAADPVKIDNEQRVFAEQLVFSLKNTVGHHVVMGNFHQALTEIETAMGDPEYQPLHGELASLKDFVAQVSKVNQFVEAGFRNKTGRNVTLRVNGKTHDLVIKEVAGGRVTGEKIGQTPGNAKVSYTFDIAQINAADRCAQLGEQATPDVNAMKFLLLMQAGQRTAARNHAEQSGPLANAFTRCLDVYGRAL